MASYKLSIKRSAQKEIRAIGQPDRGRIINRIEELANEPRPAGCEKLKGLESTYRIRQGNFRVVYSIHDEVLTVEVVKVGNRKDVYRQH